MVKNKNMKMEKTLKQDFYNSINNKQIKKMVKQKMKMKMVILRNNFKSILRKMSIRICLNKRNMI
jgi:hypothetical protein